MYVSLNPFIPQNFFLLFFYIIVLLFVLFVLFTAGLVFLRLGSLFKSVINFLNSLSAGQDFITSEQLRKQMNKIDLSELPSTSKSKEGSQNVENDFLEAEQESENDLGSHTRSRDEDNELKDDKPGRVSNLSLH